MAYEPSIQRYRTLYAQLIGFYPRQYRQRFGEGMEQTFKDLLHERAAGKRGLFAPALWMFIETSVGIIHIHFRTMRTPRTVFIALAPLALLLVPFFAMQFRVDGWDWHLFDYIVVGVLLIGAGFGLAAATNGEFPMRRRLIGLAAIGLFVLLYIHVAVGIVDSWPMAGS